MYGHSLQINLEGRKRVEPLSHNKDNLHSLYIYIFWKGFIGMIIIYTIKQVYRIYYGSSKHTL